MKKLVVIVLLFMFGHNSYSQKLITHKGQEIFVSGINLAWIEFAHDLDKFDAKKFTAAMKDIRAAGGNATRWWIHVNGLGTPTFKGDTVTGISQAAINNFVIAMDIAAEEGIVISVCLWSFDMLNKNDLTSAILTRNANLLNSSVLTQYYIDNALIPLVKATKSHPAILCWEIFNEPEGMTPVAGWSNTNKVPITSVQRFVNQCAGAIHRTDSTAKVSNGSWNSKAISYNKAINSTAYNYYADSNLVKIGGDTLGYLDFYQVHFYAQYSGDRESPFHNPVEYYQSDKPLVVGEFAAYGIIKKPGILFSPTTEKTTLQAYTWLKDSGYAGGMAWTYTNNIETGGDGNGCLTDIKESLLYLQKTYPDLINIRKDTTFNYLPRVIKKIPDTALYVGTSEILNYITLHDYFTDNESSISFDVTSSGIATASIEKDTILHLYLDDTVGYGKITVTAIDSGGKRVSQSFYVYLVNDVETNLARNKAVYTSSVESSLYEPYFINDGKSTTRWSSEYSDAQSVVIDLNKVESVSRVVLYWEAAYGLTYEIQVSDDNINWQTVYFVENSIKTPVNIDNIIFDAVDARYVKFNGIKRGDAWGYSLFEMEIYSDNGATTNHAPYYTQSVFEIKATTGALMDIRARYYYLKDDDNDMLIYSLEMLDGSVFPEWLTYDENTFYLKGTPPLTEAGKTYTFKMKAVDYFGESAEFTFPLIVNHPVNIVPVIAEEIIIYPIPAKNNIMVSFNNNLKNVISIYSEAGIEIQTLNTSDTQIDIPIGGYQRGIYFVKIVTDKSIDVRKIIVE